MGLEYETMNNLGTGRLRKFPYARRGPVSCYRIFGNLTLLGSFTVESCPGFRTLTGIAIDLVNAGSAILARGRCTLVYVSLTDLSCESVIADTHVS